MREDFKKDWFKIIITILVTFLTGLISWKIINTNLNIQFDFNNLLSLILALFSIWLSISFYFKATDQSNEFYDNSFTLTKDLSVLLGKIESQFGENLRHLEQGNLQLHNKVESISAQISQKEFLLNENEKTIHDFEEVKKLLQEMTLKTLEDDNQAKYQRIITKLEQEISGKEIQIKDLKTDIENLANKKEQIITDLPELLNRSPLKIAKDRHGKKRVQHTCNKCGIVRSIYEKELINNYYSGDINKAFSSVLKCNICDSEEIRNIVPFVK
ncbi:hypothetical protein [Bacillus toyonensis]|uniref:Uncharacterized protein n=1 Tax=Bacillus toyonensis TaxID=155322 RepID=A0A2A8H9F5_9BACI|nr:hypothetical protein [Bacillus toyonensis]PEP97011.1 hypothetical protein CN585_24605 [Bacillus toyonensis]